MRETACEHGPWTKQGGSRSEWHTNLLILAKRTKHEAVHGIFVVKCILSRNCIWSEISNVTLFMSFNKNIPSKKEKKRKVGLSGSDGLDWMVSFIFAGLG
jgi:hypothetical protein